jgi:hypothetical protein
MWPEREGPSEIARMKALLSSRVRGQIVIVDPLHDDHGHACFLSSWRVAIPYILGP